MKTLFKYKPMSASGTITKNDAASKIGFFLCTTGGTLAISEGEASGGATIVASLTLTAGQRVELMINTPLGAYATLGSGCVGTFGV